MFAVESALGWIPRYEDLDWRGINFSKTDYENAMSANREEWVQELASHDKLFFTLFGRLPKEMVSIRDLFLASLWRSPRSGEK